jgi:hypothetical protein
MLRSLFVFGMVIFALVIAILGISLPTANLKTVIIITTFFNFMLPLLAVASLVNYLWKSNCDKHCSK